MPSNELQRRDAPLAELDLDTRMLEVRVDTVNEDDRSVEAVLSTDAAVEMYDWRSGEMIDEILRNEDAEIPDQLPLLAAHNRWSLDDVLGSVRSINREGRDLEEKRIAGRLHFAEGDPPAERVWNKVRQKHLRDVSVGYRVIEFTDVPKGQTVTIRGREYTAAPNKRLRVATKWRLHEASIVPIGADQKAKTRSHIPSCGVNLMPPELRKYLDSIGLRAEATDADAWQFLAGLQGDNRAKAAQIMLGGVPEHNEREEPESNENESRNEPITPGDPAEAARAAVAAERDRVREITALAGDDVSPEIRQQAINEGWDLSRASQEFLTHVRTRRQTEPQQMVPYHPTAHTPTSVAPNARNLAAGLLIGSGIDPVASSCRMHSGTRQPLSSDAITAQDCDQGHGFARMSAVDIARACAFLDGGRNVWDPEEAVRTAVSGGTLSYVFSTNIYARLMAGWMTIGDTTTGWCDEEDVANFLQQEDISLQASSRLERLGRGDTAKHATASDSHETYKIARYAKQFVVDEQDFIDDRLGAIMRMPAEMGAAARALRPDLVYSLMLENPSLVADSGAVFNTTAVTTSGGHANLGTAALTSTALKAAITAMVKHRQNRTTKNPGEALNIRPKYLIVPADLEWDARSLTSSEMLLKLFADSSDPNYSALNLLAKEGMQPVIDDRIGAIGVTDPNTGNARTGSATNWFLTSGANRGLRVAYRRGTNRSPQLRSFTLDRGQWGLGWDINMDIGAAFMDFRTWYKSTGAA